MNVLVAGGSGFIGKSLCRRLDERGHSVTAASRSPADAELPAGVETVRADVTDPDLTAVVAGHDVVVNLVALPSHRDPSDGSHEAVHLGGTRHLVRAAEQTTVDRFVQMSGLGVDAGVRTAYFDAKREAERVVSNAALDWVIYRPSVVFGDGCAFLPFIERVTPPLVGALPGGGRMRIQPLYVEDLTLMLADGVADAKHVGQTYALGGPEKLTLAETVQLVCGSRAVVSIPMAVAGAGFTLAEFLPGIPLSRDQYRVFALDNTTADNDISAFGLTEADLTTLGAYLEDKRNGRRV